MMMMMSRHYFEEMGQEVKIKGVNVGLILTWACIVLVGV